ncbi:hypothetical protein CGCVW01_v013511, partial [Colletotrichum viniferum]
AEVRAAELHAGAVFSTIGSVFSRKHGGCRSSRPPNSEPKRSPKRLARPRSNFTPSATARLRGSDASMPAIPPITDSHGH